MKIVSTFVLIFLSLSCAYGQAVKFKNNWEPDPTDNTFAKKRFFILADYGINNMIKQTWTRVDDYGAYSDIGPGPLSLKVEYALTNKWGVLVGATYFAGNASWRVAELDTAKQTIIFDKGFDYKSTTIYIGFNTHIFTSPTVDIYLGGRVGYTLIKYNPFISIPNRKDYEVPLPIDPIHYNGYFGVRINYSRRGGVYLESGHSNLSSACIGTVYRLGL